MTRAAFELGPDMLSRRAVLERTFTLVRIHNARIFIQEPEACTPSTYQLVLMHTVLGFDTPEFEGPIKPEHGNWRQELNVVSIALSEAENDVAHNKLRAIGGLAGPADNVPPGERAH